MDEIKKRLEIARWFTEDMLGTLSEDEREKLDDWLAESPENVRDAKIIRELVENGGLENDRSEIIRRGWKDFQGRTSSKFSRKHFYKYAAIIVFPLVVASCLFFYITSRQDTVQPIAESVQAGGAKAVLILADGKEVQLDQQRGFELKEKDGTGISVSENQVLQYHPEERPENVPVDKEYYNTLVIPKGGEYKLQLADGTFVWLNAATKFRYPVRFSGDNRTVYLEGEAYFEVCKDPHHPFIVKTSEDLGVRVLGTEFNVSAYTDDAKVVTTLLGGKVEMFHAGETIRIAPDEQVSFDYTTNEFVKQKVNASMYAAWKDGLFVFEDCPMEEIMKRLERWYDIQVFYTDENIKAIHFDGDLRKYDDFNTTLELLQKVAGLKITVKNKSVVIGMK